MLGPDKVVEELQQVRETGVFIVDDVAFIQDKPGLEIGEAVARKGIKKEYYLETRGDVLLRNRDVFKLWKESGMKYMFLGVEAIDKEGLQKYRKRVSLGRNFEALELARSLGIMVAININRELVATQKVLFTKHMGWTAVRETVSIIGRQLMRGQTNFLRSLWKFDSVFNPELQPADHRMPIKYHMAPPPKAQQRVDARSIYIHRPTGRTGRHLDEASERFVDATRTGT